MLQEQILCYSFARIFCIKKKGNKFFRGIKEDNSVFILILTDISKHHNNLYKAVYRNIRFSIYFTWTFWSSNKTTQVEYGLTEALGIDIEKIKKIMPARVGHVFTR